MRTRKQHRRRGETEGLKGMVEGNGKVYAIMLDVGERGGTRRICRGEKIMREQGALMEDGGRGRE